MHPNCSSVPRIHCPDPQYFAEKAVQTTYKVAVMTAEALFGDFTMPLVACKKALGFNHLSVVLNRFEFHQLEMASTVLLQKNIQSDHQPLLDTVPVSLTVTTSSSCFN